MRQRQGKEFQAKGLVYVMFSKEKLYILENLGDKQCE